MEYVILGFVVVLILLCAAIIVKLNGIEKKVGGDEKIDKIVEQQAQQIKNTQDGQSRLRTELANTVTNSVSSLGNSLRDEYSKQSKSLEERMKAVEDELGKNRGEMLQALHSIQNTNTTNMENIQKKNGESLDKIKNTVEEKLQSTMDILEKIQSGNSKSMKEFREENGKSLDKINGTIDEKLKSTLEALEKIRTENTQSMDKLRKENSESLEKINGTVNEKLQKTLDDKISRSFETVNKHLAEVNKGLGEMQNVASGVSDLQKVLSNVKTRGTMGEIQLDSILLEVLAPEQYNTQWSLSPKAKERVDFAVKLPGKGDGEVYLPIDSKFPVEPYANLVDAYEKGDKEEIEKKSQMLKITLKNNAKSIHDKYITPPYTTDFAIMFLPSEGLYAEAVRLGMIEELQRQYKVNIAGPSTMAALLNSFQMGFRTLAIQKQSGEVWKVLEKAQKEFSTFEGVLNKTRDRLRQADEELEKMIGVRTRQINSALRDVSSDYNNTLKDAGSDYNNALKEADSD
ncbi:MAG: DNA recombination protein RmuC [Firmicutes bacterium]|nr:DNA recombination protein RmuC [Bacillota bacterium]